MEKIVILGSEGMLGGALMKQFSSMYETIGLDRKDIDVLDEAAVLARLQAEKPVCVLNATAYNSVDEAEKSPEAAELAFKINGYAVGGLARITKQLGIPLVHFSSEYVFDGTSEIGYDESAQPHPLNKYSESKELGEKELQANTNLFYLVRLSRMFGPPGISQMAKKSFVDIMLDLVQNQGKTELKVVDEERSCPTYSSDLAKFAYMLITTSQPYGIYHGANSGACTWFELAKKTFELKGIPVALIPIKSSDYPRPAKRPMFSELINTKLPKQRHWEEALKDYLA